MPESRVHKSNLIHNDGALHDVFARLHAHGCLVKFYCKFLCTSVHINMMQKTMHIRRERGACITLYGASRRWSARPVFIKNLIKWMRSGVLVFTRPFHVRVVAAA